MVNYGRSGRLNALDAAIIFVFFDTIVFKDYSMPRDTSVCSGGEASSKKEELFSDFKKIFCMLFVCWSCDIFHGGR